MQAPSTKVLLKVVQMTSETEAHSQQHIDRAVQAAPLTVRAMSLRSAYFSACCCAAVCAKQAACPVVASTTYVAADLAADAGARTGGHRQRDAVAAVLASARREWR